jgi:hypothetical protein
MHISLPTQSNLSILLDSAVRKRLICSLPLAKRFFNIVMTNKPCSILTFCTGGLLDMSGLPSWLNDKEAHVEGVGKT